MFVLERRGVCGGIGYRALAVKAADPGKVRVALFEHGRARDFDLSPDEAEIMAQALILSAARARGHK